MILHERTKNKVVFKIRSNKLVLNRVSDRFVKTALGLFTENLFIVWTKGGRRTLELYRSD